MVTRGRFVLAGSPGVWLAHFRGLGEQMSEAIQAAWPICIGPLQAKKDSMTHEDHITEHLVHALRRTKRVPGRITYQYRSEEHTSELQSLMRISYAVFCLKQKNNNTHKTKKSYNRSHK